MKKESIASLIIALLGTGLFTTLLVKGIINQVSFITLFGTNGLICLVIMSLSRLKVLDLKNLKLTLSELKQVKKDIYAKEDDLKESSKIISELILFNSLFASRFGSSRSIKYTQLWTKQKAKELLENLKIPADQKDHVFRFAKLFDEMDSRKDDSTDHWDGIVDKVAEECNEK